MSQRYSIVREQDSKAEDPTGHGLDVEAVPVEAAPSGPPSPPRSFRLSANSLHASFVSENGGDVDPSALKSGRPMDSGGAWPAGEELSQNEARARLHDEFYPRYGALFDEVKRLAELRHPNIVQTVGLALSKGQYPVMLVREFMSNGSLHNIIHNDQAPLDLELQANILVDCVRGLKYLHEAEPRIVHGNLKSTNILINARMTGKLTDFGLSFLRGNDLLEGSSLPYLAPELLTGDADPSEVTDVYALGVVMYEMFTGREPYGDEIEGGITKRELVHEITTGNLRPALPGPGTAGPRRGGSWHVPAEFTELMAECWHKNPLRRPSIKEIEERVLGAIKDNDLLRKTYTVNKQQEKLLQDILPPKVIKALAEGRKVEPEPYDPVTIFFSDIVGFTTISQTMPPEKVMAMLDDMYSRFDALVRKHGLFKVETIGDAYMCVGGIPEPQADHTLRVARFSIDAINSAAEVPIDAEDPGKGYVKIRCGFHSGSVVASVVGSVNPRYCLFGDTVNVASRMESNSLEKRINMSPQAHAYLMEQSPEAACEDRGQMEIKGKGKMNCWFLTGIGELAVGGDISGSTSGRSLEAMGSFASLSRLKSSRGSGKYG